MSPARMQTFASVDGVREAVRGWRACAQTVVLVPTMGNLHRGHLELVQLAARVADRVVVSIFVNPTQFGAGEDFERYPRTPREDEAALESSGVVDAVFAPHVDQMYPFGIGDAVRIALPPLAHELCGASRPGHFDGVGTVVCRLLNAVTPDALVLGRKDYQQLVLVERMVADLRLPVRVISGPTVRDADGLAMSSRNRYLDAEERVRAPALPRALQAVKRALETGRRDFATLEQSAMRALREAGFEPDYVAIRRAADLGQPSGQEAAAELLVLGAARLGAARLIDNTSD